MKSHQAVTVALASKKKELLRMESMPKGYYSENSLGIVKGQVLALEWVLNK